MLDDLETPIRRMRRHDHQPPGSTWSRREVIGALGTAIGVGVASEFPWTEVPLANSSPGQAGATRFANGAVIRTIVKDADPGTITGATLMHEHLGNGRRPSGRGEGRTSAVAVNTPPDTPQQDVDWMTTELQAARKAGVGCIVSAQTNLPGAEVADYLRLLSERTGLHLINAAAYYTRQTYPREIETQTEEQIADRLVQAASANRVGAFGEFGVGNNQADLDPIEKKVFRAAGLAHMRTGVPLFTHNNYSTGPQVRPEIALHQLDQFEAVGVKPEHVAIGHMCCLDDPKSAVAQQIAKRGAFVAFDRVTRQQQWVSDEHRVMMVMTFLEAGYIDHLLFSSDYIGRVNAAVGEVNMYPGPLHARDGGPGYARPLLLFLPKLRSAGVSEQDIRRITEDNPRRFLAFIPKPA
jgi:phosphotriesterase-related protein